MKEPCSVAVARRYGQYYEWLASEWGYEKWKTPGPRMLFYYSVAGAQFAGKADEWLDLVKAGDLHKIPPVKQKTWETIDALASTLEDETGSCLVPALLGSGWWDAKWNRLQRVHTIGPKIAAWFLRDLSFLKDHVRSATANTTDYGDKRAPGWFRKLEPEMQAYFVPVDIHVYAGAKSVGLLQGPGWPDNIKGVQGHPEEHHRAALAITDWAIERDLDVRDLDVYWYCEGSGAFGD